MANPCLWDRGREGLFQTDLKCGAPIYHKFNVTGSMLGPWQQRGKARRDRKARVEKLGGGLASLLSSFAEGFLFSVFPFSLSVSASVYLSVSISVSLRLCPSFPPPCPFKLTSCVRVLRSCVHHGYLEEHNKICNWDIFELVSFSGELGGSQWVDS